MSSDDAAELEELRREAALLREQLENAVGPQSGLRSARDVHQLEARIDSLAARNAKLMDTLKDFQKAQQQLRWLYQYLIVTDYLPRIVGQDVVTSLIRRRGTGPIQFTGKLYQPRNVNKPYMPVEYAGAAYRFGHSMIRAEYEVQDGHTVPIFGQDGYEDLRGNRQIPASLWIDWNYFFEIPGMDAPDDRNMARKIDTQLSLPLTTKNGLAFPQKASAGQQAVVAAYVLTDMMQQVVQGTAPAKAVTAAHAKMVQIFTQQGLPQ